MDMILIPAVNMTPILPEIFLSVLAMVLLLINVFRPGGPKSYLAYVSFIGIIATAVLVGAGWGGHIESFSGSVVLDNFATFFKLTFLVAAGLTVLITDSYMEREECNHGELYPLILFAVVGMMLMASGTDLMTIFLGLEVMSVTLYVLAGFNRANKKSNEAGLKYFLLGSFSTGFMLYGMALIYGATGTTRLYKIAAVVGQMTIPSANIMLVAGMLLMMTGFAFKIAAAPFHMWTPDVYEGSPTPVTAFFAAAPKIAAMALFLRVVFGPFAGAQHQWFQIIAVISVASMILGAVAAIGQTNIKRLMAYSSIGHMGYALIGFAAASPAGVQGVLIYLVIYLAMTAGTFVVIMMMRRNGHPIEEIAELSGLSARDPTTAYLLAILMFSLAGIPPLAGFWGKFFVFYAAIQAGLYWLAVVGFVTSVIGAYYYLNIVRLMFFEEPAQAFEKPLGTVNAMLLAGSTAFVLFFVVLPAPLVAAAQVAAQSLFK